MDFETLHLFQEVAHRLSFAAVAEERGVNPSSVSRAIGQLEKQLGARLFQRTTRRMALTEAGVNFLQRASVIVEEMEAACDDLRSDPAGPAGTLRLSASVAFGERVVLPLVDDFRESFPNLRLDLMFSDDNVDLVAEGIDLAIRLASGLRGDLVATRLMNTRYMICASPDYLAGARPLKTPSDLADHRCVLFTMPAFRSEWTFRSSDGLEEAVAIDGDLAISSALSLRSAVLAGMGPALLVDWLVAQDLAEGRLVNLFPDHAVTATTFDTAAWLVYPSRSYLPLKVRATIDFLRAKVRKSAGGVQV